ncbi:diacylglycerol/polyprenol kinase family protein [Thalassoroseus pseudoceratinae]|uniref:hypothetical protein n=1 Tax=Thalassoroseus pseudoceratinae TaxID=2713176 RepID=UPI00142255A3|nr:hypothetical protein [Thalassoroseus pseudoceratinae]
MDQLHHLFPTNYLLTLVIHNVVLAAWCWLLGLAVLEFGVKVNYTRKLNHFVLFMLPIALAPLLPYEPNVWTISASAVVFLATTAIFSRPIRERFSIVRTAFASVDRPEDRPYTLCWIITQALAAYATLVGVFFVLRAWGDPRLITIPLLITAIGDGLAEPVGVRFGRHRYRVMSWVSGREYVRSWEGSACVLVSSVVILLCMSSLLTTTQLICLLLFLPPLMTLIEAVAPHSWDAPFLYVVGGGTIAIVLLVFPTPGMATASLSHAEALMN